MPPPPSQSAESAPAQNAEAVAPRATCERILDAAESLFAADGIDATSLRRITRTAAVNLAAIHYHFGSKEGLLDAVVARRAEPVGAAQEAGLAALDADGEADVRAVLRVFLAPVMESRRTTAAGPILGSLFARLQAQPAALVESLFRRHFGEISAQFVAALQRALPDLPASIVADRFRFAVGVVTHVFSGGFALDTIPGHPCACAPTDRESDLLDALISFLAAGLEAPASGPARLRSIDRAETGR